MASLFKPDRVLWVLCWACLLLGAQLATAADTTTPATTTPDRPLRVSLILEHDSPADSWTSQLKAGLAQARSQLAVEGKVVLAPRNDQQEEIFRQAARDSDLVIVAQEALFEILRNNAANFRQTKFGCVDTGIRAPNIMSVIFADEQAAFLAGAAAGLLTTHTELKGMNADRTVGWLSGEDIPVLRSLLDAFERGAKLDHAATRVVHGVAGSFADPEACRSEARRLLAAGADIIVLAAGSANSGARAEVLKAGKTAIDVTPAPAAPYAASIHKDAARAVFEIIRSAAQGHFAGKKILTLELGAGTDFSFTPQGSGGLAIPPHVGQRLKELRHELREGTIPLRKLRTPTLCDC